MKITIEFDENTITKKEATQMTLDCLSTCQITKRIKPDKNVKFRWDDKTVGILTQQGNHQVIMRTE